MKHNKNIKFDQPRFHIESGIEKLGKIRITSEFMKHPVLIGILDFWVISSVITTKKLPELKIEKIQNTKIWSFYSNPRNEPSYK